MRLQERWQNMAFSSWRREAELSNGKKQAVNGGSWRTFPEIIGHSEQRQAAQMRW